jgi:hypothetical protein
MSERITAIEEVDTVLKNDKGYVYSMAGGFKITTERQTIELLIDESPQCCEEYGYFMSEDDIQGFVGANLLGLNIVDTGLRLEKLPEDDWDKSTNTLFVNIETDRGLLQFTAYNSHNGGYGHDAVIRTAHVEYEVEL